MEIKTKFEIGQKIYAVNTFITGCYEILRCKVATITLTNYGQGFEETYAIKPCGEDRPTITCNNLFATLIEALAYIKEKENA